MKANFVKIKGYSHTWQTTLMVLLMVIISVSLSMWFFWRSLYLPELQNHANYLANQLLMVEKAERDWQAQPMVTDWIINATQLQVIDNPDDFPEVEEKTFVGFFTNTLASKMGDVLGRPATVYFKFKPMPLLYLQDSHYPNRWYSEPVKYYAQYSPASLWVFLLGIPLLTILTILFLVRQLNRPLKRLQKAAMDYITLGHATSLATNQGSLEIRQVNLAFNRLFHNLNQTQKERTIMLAGISHDLRTPLTRMRLTAEMLPDEFLKEGLVYDIEDMDAILEQFISFMKDGSDEAVRLTQLRPIFNEIVVQFAPLAFVIDLPADMPAVPLRPLSIKRLIVNLVNNASRYGKPPIHLSAQIIDHTQSKPPSEQLSLLGAHNSTIGSTALTSMNLSPTAKTEPSTELSDISEKYLQISVSDEGEGVAEDQLDRIMQPFERGETARTTQGSGLGLAIVSRIAHLHNGTVVAFNQAESGLNVTVNIPIMD